MIDAAVKKDFLRELSKLTKKYGVGIAGCGCCQSPFLTNAKGSGSYEVDDHDGSLRYVGKK